MSYWDDLIERQCEKLMSYPREFRDKCSKLYKDNKRIMSLLQKRSFLLGKELERKASSVISIDETANAKTVEELKMFQKKLRIQKQREELYNDWFALYDEQYLKYGRSVNSFGNVVESAEIKLEYEVRHEIIKRGERVTRSQLQNSVDNLAPIHEQAAVSRAIGSDRAAGYRAR